MNKQQLLDHVKYHESRPIPNNALYITRITNLKGLLDFVEAAMAKSGRDLKTVLGVFAHNRELVMNSFPYITDAFDILIKDFGETTGRNDLDQSVAEV